MKEINGFSKYGITSCGKAYSYSSKKFVSVSESKGYLFFQLYDDDGNKRTVPVHRAVALAYLPNPKELRTVDHIDGNPKHNWVNNLQWMSDLDNVTKSQGKRIRCIETGQIFKSQSEAAKAMGCCHQNISNCLRGKAKTACGYHWEVLK